MQYFLYKYVRETQDVSVASQGSRVLSSSISQWLDEEHREGTDSDSFHLYLAQISHLAKELAQKINTV